MSTEDVRDCTLLDAAKSGSVDVVGALLEWKPEGGEREGRKAGEGNRYGRWSQSQLDFRSLNRQTALHMASERGHVGVVEMLLRAGARTELRDSSDSTALALAAEKGKDGVVEALIRAGADLNAKDGESRTALMLAVNGGMQGSLGALLRAAAADARGRPSAAEREGKQAVVEALIRAGADVNARGGENMTALMWACRSRQDDCGILEALLRAGADVSAADVRGRTALMHAVEQGGRRVEALMRAGADVNAKDSDGRTTLMLAAEKCKDDAVQALVRAGADVNAVDDKHETALMYALSSWGRPEGIVEALIQAGADVNAKDHTGKTALMFAAAKGRQDLMGRLVQAGAGVDAVDDGGMTALQHANAPKPGRLVFRPAVSRLRGAHDGMKELFGIGHNTHVRAERWRHWWRRSADVALGHCVPTVEATPFRHFASAMSA